MPQTREHKNMVLLLEEFLRFSQHKSWVHPEPSQTIVSASSTSEYFLGQSKLVQTMSQHLSLIHI